MREIFETLSTYALGRLRAGEHATIWFDGEDSDFVRFNHGKVRQPGTVHQRSLHLRLLVGQKQVGAEVTVSGVPADDRARLDALLAGLRDTLPHLPDDPHLLWNPDGPSLEDAAPSGLPDATEVVDAVLAGASGADGGDPVDLVGILASGPVASGYASSTGQRCWFSRASYTLDWCLYHQADKAVKSTLAGPSWDPAAFTTRMAQARDALAVLARPVKRLDPGRYRAYLTPAAVQEIVELLSWGGFGLKSQRTRQSPLQKLVDGEAVLDPRITLLENLAEGTAPTFQADGFPRAGRTALVVEGRPADPLVSPRSSREFGVATNGAGGGETPDAMDLAAGGLAEADILAALGTGLYVSNLWYLNFSDRPAGRLTGMTRFATSWVENGRIVAPAEVMRFDDTAYNLLGAELEALTAERSFLMDTGTYTQRGVKSWRLPGALLRGMAFTL